MQATRVPQISWVLDVQLVTDGSDTELLSEITQHAEDAGC